MTDEKDWAEKKAEEIVLANGGRGECICDPAYRERRRTDPKCPWCNWGEDCVRDFAKALRESRKIDWPSEKEFIRCAFERGDLTSQQARWAYRTLRILVFGNEADPEMVWLEAEK